MGGISLAGDTNVHGGAPFDTGLTTTVLIQGKGIALSGQTGSSQNDTQYNQNPRAHPQGVSSNQTAAAGSDSVFAEGKAIHRIKDARKDGATAGPGSSSVLADGGTAGAGGAGDNAASTTAGSGSVSGTPAGFTGTFDPAIFVIEPDGRVLPRANAVPGVDYTIRYTDSTQSSAVVINLHDFTPDATNVGPVVAGQGVAHTWTIPGVEGSFQTLTPYTVDQYNPPLAAFGNLSVADQRALISEYAIQNNIGFMTNGPDGPSNPAYYESDAFRNFLASKDLGNSSDNTGG
jgi:hypothetical protein